MNPNPLAQQNSMLLVLVGPIDQPIVFGARDQILGCSFSAPSRQQ